MCPLGGPVLWERQMVSMSWMGVGDTLWQTGSEVWKIGFVGPMP